MRRMLSFLVLAAALPVLSAAAGEDWTARVPDFRSSWPEPPAPGTAGPEFVLVDASTGKPVLLKRREGVKATLLLFLDENCGTCRRRAADLGASLRRSRSVDGAAVRAVFTRNLRGGGRKAVREFARTADIPADLPILVDDRGGRAEATLAFRVPVTPCAVVLDGEWRVAYFGLALDPKGSDLLPGIVAAVAAGKPVDGPAVRPPFG